MSKSEEREQPAAPDSGERVAAPVNPPLTEAGAEATAGSVAGAGSGSGGGTASSAGAAIPPVPAESDPERPADPADDDIPGQAGEEHDFAPEGLRRALEAILIVVDEPVGDVELAQVLECPTEAVTAALNELAAEYVSEGRGFALRHVAGGWRFYSDPESAAYVERFVLDGQSGRLSQAALETLAVVAYLQPVTRARVGSIRGVNVEAVMRTLQARGLIEESGQEGPGGATLFRTTRLFLEKMGLNALAQLPSLAPLLPDVATFLQEEESLSP